MPHPNRQQIIAWMLSRGGYDDVMFSGQRILWRKGGMCGTSTVSRIAAAMQR